MGVQSMQEKMVEPTNPLEKEFNSLVRTLEATNPISVESISYTEGLSRQYKYRTEDAKKFKDILLSHGAIEDPKGPVQQGDHYLLQPSDERTANIDRLCWREERPYVDYSAAEGGAQKDALICKLVLATSSRQNDPNPDTTMRQIIIDDSETQSEALSLIYDMRQDDVYTPLVIDKKSTKYIFPMSNGNAIIDVDENVQLIEKDRQIPVGDFIRIKVPVNTTPDAVSALKVMLGISGDSFDVPYVASDFAQEYHQSRPAVISRDEHDPERIWQKYSHAPYYYDASKDTFVIGPDPDKLKKFIGTERLQAIAEIEKICEDFTESDSSGGNSSGPLSRSSGKGSGSSTYEHFPHHDGFKKQSYIKSGLASHSLWRKKWNPGGKRIAFSRVAFKDDREKYGIIIHYMGDHDGYDRWLKRHGD